MTEPLEQFPDWIEKLEAVGAANYQQHLLPRSEQGFDYWDRVITVVMN